MKSKIHEDLSKSIFSSVSKKLLLLLFLFLSLSIYAQPPSSMPPYTVCDGNNDGFETFDLSSQIPAILNGLNPANVMVTFHETLIDSQTGANPITAINSYVNITPQSQTIYIRVVDNATSDIYFSTINLIVNPTPTATITGNSSVCQNSGNTTITLTGAGGIAPYVFTVLNNNGTVLTFLSPATGSITFSVSTATAGTISLLSVQSSGCTQNLSGSPIVTINPAPTANPATLQFCDMMELAIYNLHDADNQVTGGAAGFSITYHETLTDAEIGANPVGEGGYIPIVTPVQTLFASVTSPATGCRSITTLTLNTHNCGEACPAPINLVASAVTDTTFALNWTNPPGWMGAIYYSVLLLPYGSPAPAHNTTGSLYVTTPAPFIVTGLSPNACYSVYIKAVCSSGIETSMWSAPLNICMPNCADSGACAEALVLNAFLDSNNNGVKDTGEVDFNHGNFVYQLNDSGSNQYGTSNDGSYYIFDSNPGNSYDISFAVNTDFAPYYTSSVSHNNITLPTGSGANYLYFPIANPVPYVDAHVYLYPSVQPRPGFAYSNTIYYQNNGFQTIPNGTLTFTKHPTISINSISETGAITTSTGFTYDFTNLAPFEVRYINVNLLVPTIPTVNLGDLVTNTVSVQIANDINLANNSSSITQTIVGSYDPNDKMESHGGKIVHSTFTSNDYLYYTIQFENTGSANAEFVRVEDALDSQLDENTFEMLTASHNVDTKRIGTQLTWHFYNIDLPPTSSNPSGSHGFVSFKIKPKPGYAIGDVIPNTASIYFDYNPAIVTNQFDTEFVLTLGNPAFNANTISLYPNPTSDGVTISNSNTNDKIATVVIYDVSGKRVYTLNKNTLNDINVDVSNFARGLYLVELTSEDNTKITKKLLLK